MQRSAVRELKALRSYCKEWDEEKGIWRNSPRKHCLDGTNY
jgi:hypothetical protein